MFEPAGLVHFAFRTAFSYRKPQSPIFSSPFPPTTLLLFLYLPKPLYVLPCLSPFLSASTEILRLSFFQDGLSPPSLKRPPPSRCEVRVERTVRFLYPPPTPRWCFLTPLTCAGAPSLTILPNDRLFLFFLSFFFPSTREALTLPGPLLQRTCNKLPYMRGQTPLDHSICPPTEAHRRPPTTGILTALALYNTLPMFFPNS